MKADYNGLSDTEGDADYLKANEIVKYVDGICYYEAPIQDVNEGCSIIRNNWYQLTVTKVDDLGWPGARSSAAHLSDPAESKCQNHAMDYSRQQYRTLTNT